MPEATDKGITKIVLTDANGVPYDLTGGGGGGGSVATDTIWDVKGDLAAGTGANTASRVAVGSDGTVLVADAASSAGVKWNVPIGTVVDYQEFAADVSISATTEAAANTVVTGAGFTPNGTDAFWLEFYSPAVAPGATIGSAVIIVLYDNGAVLAPSRIAQVVTPASSSLIVPVSPKIRLVPTNAAHTYSVRAYRAVSNGTIFGAAATNMMPGHILITKASN